MRKPSSFTDNIQALLNEKEQTEESELQARQTAARLSGIGNIMETIGKGTSVPTGIEIAAGVTPQNMYAGKAQALSRPAAMIAESEGGKLKDVLNRYNNALAQRQKGDDRQLAFDQKKELLDYKYGRAADLMGKKAAIAQQKKEPEGLKVIDRKAAQEYDKFILGGGYSDTMDQLKQLNFALGGLKKTDLATGPVIGSLPDFLRPIVTPGGVAIEDRVRQVVQRSLRQTLGGQFAEREGEKLIAAAFNKKLDEKENAQRLKDLIEKIKLAADAKKKALDYFVQNNYSMRGYKGPVFDPNKEFNLEDTNYDILGGSGTALASDKDQKMLPTIDEVDAMSDEELDRALRLLD